MVPMQRVLKYHLLLQVHKRGGVKHGIMASVSLKGFWRWASGILWEASLGSLGPCPSL